MERKKFLLSVGLVVGILSFLFLLMDSAMNYSDNASFCLNCHTMQKAYDTQQTSNHKQFKCSECHAPQAYTYKVIFKTKSGLRDLYVTTLGEIPQLIKATTESQEVITNNCIRCHQSTVEKVAMGLDRKCSDCHRNLAH